MKITDAEAEVWYAVRGERAWASRLTARLPRLTNIVTVIAGVSGGETEMVLYTAHLDHGLTGDHLRLVARWLYRNRAIRAWRT